MLFSRGSRPEPVITSSSSSLGVVLFSRGSRHNETFNDIRLCLGVVLFSRGSRLKYFNSGAE